MLIVDSNIHVWNNGTPMAPHQSEPYLPEQALADMDKAGVDAAIIHPPTWDSGSASLALEAAAAAPSRFAVIDQIPTDATAGLPALKAAKANPNMLAIRFAVFMPDQAALLETGGLDWVWPAAEELEVPIAMFISNYLPLVGKIAERHPKLKLTIDHMGTVPGKKGEEAFAKLPELVALAKNPSVSVKASAGPIYATDSYPFYSLQDYYKRIFDAFGPKRIFWGTDVTRMPCSWEQCVTHFRDHIDWLRSEDKELIMGRAVCEWFGWNAPLAHPHAR